MGLLERMAEVKAESMARAWPVGETVMLAGNKGHDDARFSPENYGDYLATSNDIYACANLRAKRMSRLNPLLFDGYGTDRVTVTEHPAVDLLRKVNPFWTFQRLMRMDELSMCVWGETYWAVQRDGRGNPVEIWWMKPSQVRPIVHESSYLAGYSYQPASGGDPIRFGVDEVIWFRYPNPIDQFSALSPLAAARLAADTATDMTKSNQAMFRQGMQMAGTITPPSDGNRAVSFSSDQATELETDLANRFTGSRNAHRWAVLRFDAKFNPMGVTQKDADFIAGLNMSFRQVCRVYGISPALLGDLEHATLANVASFDLALWVELQCDADFRAAEITEQFLPMFRAGPDEMEWDYSRIPALQEAETSVWDREAQQLDRGVVTVNEVRAGRGKPPVPWGDAPWMPVNKAQVSDDEHNPSNEPQVAQVPTPEVFDDEETADMRRILSAFNGHGRRPQGVLT
jgi:HK97 family phage portal protein